MQFQDRDAQDSNFVLGEKVAKGNMAFFLERPFQQMGFQTI